MCGSVFCAAAPGAGSIAPLSRHGCGTRGEGASRLRVCVWALALLAAEVDHLDGDGGLGGLLDLISSHEATLRGVSSVTLGSIGPEFGGTLRARYGHAGGRRLVHSAHEGSPVIQGRWTLASPRTRRAELLHGSISDQEDRRVHRRHRGGRPRRPAGPAPIRRLADG